MPRGRHIGFQADDGLYAGGFGGIVELDHTKHGPVIGNGKRRHAQLFGALHQFFDIAETVKQRIVRVDVQVGKWHLIQFTLKNKSFIGSMKPL